MAGHVSHLFSSLVNQGFALALSGDGDKIEIRPFSQLTPDQLQQVRAHRSDLVELLRLRQGEESGAKTAPLVEKSQVPKSVLNILTIRGDETSPLAEASQGPIVPAVAWTHRTAHDTEWRRDNRPHIIPAGTPCMMIPRSRLAEFVGHDRREIWEFERILSREPAKVLVWLEGRVRALRRNQLALLGQ